MKITLELGEAYAETELIVRCRQVDEEVERLLQQFQSPNEKLIVTQGEKTFFLSPQEVFYLESVERKCFVYTQTGTYESAEKLLELEERLDSHRFMRISKSVIVNMASINNITRNFDATMKLELVGGERLIASRHYARALKERLWKG